MGTTLQIISSHPLAIRIRITEEFHTIWSNKQLTQSYIQYIQKLIPISSFRFSKSQKYAYHITKCMLYLLLQFQDCVMPLSTQPLSLRSWVWLSNQKMQEVLRNNSPLPFLYKSFYLSHMLQLKISAIINMSQNRPQAAFSVPRQVPHTSSNCSVIGLSSGTSITQTC